jgi:Tfp pilus assembly protein PilO
MTTETPRAERWPAWAKLILIALLILVALSVLPWIFMWTTMGMNMMGMDMSAMRGACLAMMERTGGMMR